MSERYFFGSLTRVANLREREFEVKRLPKSEWREADFVAGQITPPLSANARAELPSGRMIDLVEGDRMIGALGVRMATLSAVGDWRHIGDDLRMDALTSAGLFGKATYVNFMEAPLAQLEYLGHVHVDDTPANMADFVLPMEELPYDVPTILIIGTSMDAGKTTAAKVIIRHLKAGGKTVVGAKVTGAARYRDILAMHDAGADAIFDFVDVGMPSSIAPEHEFRPKLRRLLTVIGEVAPDVAVIEAGASPLEPYNGAVAMKELGPSVKFTVLCALDPYAVVGVMRGFGLIPDIAAGVATATSAGIAIVKQLADVPAINLLDANDMPELEKRLAEALG